MDEEMIDMPNFEEIEGVENVVLDAEEEKPVEKPKRGRKPKADKVVMTPEEKKEQMRKYYEANKEHRLEYKKASRETGKVESDKCVLQVEPIPQYVDNGGKKRVANLEYLRYGGSKRTLTIHQVSDKVLTLLRACGLVIDESVVEA
jgi:hypothetical protein